MRWFSRPSVERLADPYPLPFEALPAEEWHTPKDCPICQRYEAEAARTPEDRLLRAIAELPPIPHPTVIVSVTGAGIAFDLQVTTDLATARTIIDDALSEL